MSPITARKHGWIFYGIAIAVLLSSCSSKFGVSSRDQFINAYDRRQVSDSGLNHVIYTSVDFSNRKILHVYIEGDGKPWIRGVYRSNDPSSNSALIFELMALDDSTKIYLGRPCYNGLHKTDNCDQSMWTSHRYSEAVVASMSGSLSRLFADYELVLIGHSGGGTLAMLIAEKLDQVIAVVTVASNLDTDEWVKHHGYQPLDGSLNPARRIGISSHIKQVHLAGGKDENVPAYIVEAFAQSQSNAKYLYYEGYDHECCWAEIWPETLKLLRVYQ